MHKVTIPYNKTPLLPEIINLKILFDDDRGSSRRQNRPPYVTRSAYLKQKISKVRLEVNLFDHFFFFVQNQ
jgi:hypothetical protein